MTTETDRIEIDTVDFQVSCRRFTVSATITRDRQLPLVDEFVLRLLAILDRMSVARMRAWFGFSGEEMGTVLVDMGRRNLIEFEGDDVALAPAGRDLFNTVGDDGSPRIVEVGPLVGDVWFDLVSRSMVPRSRSRPADYLVKLTEIPSARELPETFAQVAFEENFRDYVRRIRRFPDPDAINLYSISGVHGGTYGYQVLQASLVLDMDRMGVRPIFPDVGDNAIGFQKLTVAANDAWQVVSPPDAPGSAVAEFERLTGETRLAALLNVPEGVAEWVGAFARSEVAGSQFRPTVGASYLRSNVDKLLLTLEQTKNQELVREILWLRPNGATWGRTVRVAETLEELRNVVRNRSHKEPAITLVMPRSTQRTVRSSHKRLFDRGVLLPQSHLPSNLEILLIPGIAAIVNVHVPVGGHAAPIGGLVTDIKRLERIIERLQPAKGINWEAIWQRPTLKSRGDGVEVADT